MEQELRPEYLQGSEIKLFYIDRHIYSMHIYSIYIKLWDYYTGNFIDLLEEIH